MDEYKNSILEAWKNLQGLMVNIEYATCEVFLNFLLIIYAVFSYLLTKFARSFKLQIPCILCSRLDHVFGNEKPEFYCNLLCGNHRSEISSLSSCCIHGNLADGNSMCEECFLSFAMNLKSSTNPDVDRLLMGKFGVDLRALGGQSSLMKGEHVPGLGSMGVKPCSCCSKPWKLRQSSDKRHFLKPPRTGASAPNIPLPGHLNHRENLKKMREKFSGSAAPNRLGKFGFDPLPNVGYKELKISSDLDSEFPFSDDEEGNRSARRAKEPKEVPPITLTNYFHFDSHRDRSDRGQPSNQKNHPSVLPELISLDDFPVLSHGTESTEKSECKFQISQNSNSSALSELLALVDAPSLFNTVKGPLESSHWKADGTGTSNIRNRHDETFKPVVIASRGTVNIDQVADEVTSVNQTDDSKSVVNSKESEAPKKYSEKPEEDENLVPSEANKQVSDAHQHHPYELQPIDPSSSNVAQMVQETASIESALDTVDGSSISETEGDGENIVDKLKRQIENDRRCINTLYKELEEERNASAIAANQAMAMITRLQEEKATFHMEALQYLRMMEEQAEYDVEALEKANDLLAEKEKEIQDMESDMEYLRLQFFEEAAGQIIPGGSFNINRERLTLENSSISQEKDGINIPSASCYNHEDSSQVKSSLTGFEDEKLYISQCLKNLERKFHNASHPDTTDKGESSENMDTNTSTDENKIAPGSDKQHKESDLVNIENEISDLNERLEALEDGWNFLEHTLNSLQTGKEGLHFVQQIAHQLHELRKTMETGRSQLVP